MENHEKKNTGDPSANWCENFVSETNLKKISCSARKSSVYHIRDWIDFERSHAKIHGHFQFNYDDIDYVFGQADGSYRSRRGFEKILFRLTIVLVIIFVFIAVLNVRF